MSQNFKIFYIYVHLYVYKKIKDGRLVYRAYHCTDGRWAWNGGGRWSSDNVVLSLERR
jgi:hypothetical protein